MSDIKMSELIKVAKELNEKVFSKDDPIKLFGAKKLDLIKELIDASSMIEEEDDISEETMNILDSIKDLGAIGGKAEEPKVKKEKEETRVDKLGNILNDLKGQKFTRSDLLKKLANGDNPTKHDAWYISIVLKILFSCQYITENKEGELELV